MRRIIITLLCFLASTSPASAATLFNFWYEMSQEVVHGSLWGTLQPDGNTIVVTATGELKFNEFSAGVAPYVDSYSTWSGGSSKPAVVTLDGSSMDLVACNSAGCDWGLFFFPPNSEFGSSITFSLAGFVGYADFQPGSWRIEAAADTPAVPESATWAMMIAGFGLAGVALRRRREGRIVARRSRSLP